MEANAPRYGFLRKLQAKPESAVMSTAKALMVSGVMFTGALLSRIK